MIPFDEIEKRVLATQVLDVHKVTAAKLFGVPYEEVTPEQRRIGKAHNFGKAYGGMQQ